MRGKIGILTIGLLIAFIMASGCIVDFGQTKLDFGNSDAAQKAFDCFRQTYGDPAAYNGPPRLIAPLASTEIKDTIPTDKVTKFSTDTTSIFFWVVYQNFQTGDDLHLSWIFRNNVVTTITKKTDSQTGVAFGEFVRPDAGWPVGTHTINIEGRGTSTQVTFDITNSPTERTVFDFTGPEGMSCSDLMAYIPVTPPATNADYWISGRTYNPVFTCYPPTNIIRFMGNTGPAVTPGTLVQLKIFNIPDSGMNDLPPEGVLIGSTNTRNDGSWELTWDGDVEGFGLSQNQEYMVKVMLPDGTYTKVSLPYQCQGTEAINWYISDNGRQVLSCSPPNNTIRFRGGTGSDVPPGTRVTLKLFNMPDAGTQEIFIGYTNTRNDGSWEYSWNGNVPGYTFINGQEYRVKNMLPGGRYTKVDFLYQCPT